MMLDTMDDQGLSRHLMGIANDSALRQVVYEHMGEYCHQCRNRLNSLKLCLYLAKRQSHPTIPIGLATLEEHYARLERSIDQIQTLCRPMAVSLSSLGLDLLIQDRRPGWARVASDRDVEIDFNPPTVRAVARFDPDRMGQALDVLVDWRVSRLAPGSSVRMSWRVDRGEARLSWEEASNAFAPVASTDDPANAWALPLITRVAEAHGGEVRTYPGDHWRLDVDWPSRTSARPAG